VPFAVNWLQSYVYAIRFDSKTDSKTGKQQWILVDMSGSWIGLGSGLRMLADTQKHEMPMEGFEPSTLAGPVFETGAYTVPPRRLVTRIQSNLTDWDFARTDAIRTETTAYPS
jgi:hypothetical protein